MISPDRRDRRRFGGFPHPNKSFEYHAPPFCRESPLMYQATEGPSGQGTDKSPGWVLRMIGIQHPPQAYLDAVAHLRDARVIHRPYARPTHGEGGDFQEFNRVGSTLKESRKVRESGDPLRHMTEARGVMLDDPSFEACSLQPQMNAVVDDMVRRGARLPALRQRQGQTLCNVADSLREYNAVIVSMYMPWFVRLVAGSIHIAFMAALVEAIEWPDTRLPYYFMYGFPVVGDGSAAEPGVRDSGLFRRVDRPSQSSVSDLARGLAKPHLSNSQWLRRVCSMLCARASAAPPSSESHAAIQKAHELAEKETRARPQPTLMPGMTLRGLARWATQFGGLNKVRVMPRFAIAQGTKKDGSVKWRGIDDGKASGHGCVTATSETTTSISFMFPVLVARRAVRTAHRMRAQCPPLWFGLDDLRAAYRVVPNSMPWMVVIAVWSFAARCVLFYHMPGHPFGLIASVLNFNRLPHFICAVAQIFFVLAVDHYVDDYINVDLASAESSGQDALRLIHILLGLDIELDKRTLNAPSNPILGVFVNIATAHRPKGSATVEPLPSRIASVLESMRMASSRGKLTPAEAGKLRGKLGFTLLPVMWRVGRAACQPLVKRQYSWYRHTAWDAPLQAMHEFFERVLPNLPPLEVPMRPLPTRPVLVYTDASYYWCRRSLRHMAILGLYAFDPATNREVWSWLRLPDGYYAHFAPDKKTYIAQAELIAALAAYVTLQPVCREKSGLLVPGIQLAGRRVAHFIDNTVALAALVHGYANAPDMAAMVNALHEMWMVTKCHVWSEWVPSLANIADWPSRPDKMHLIPTAAMEIQYVLPSTAVLAPPRHLDSTPRS